MSPDEPRQCTQSSGGLWQGARLKVEYPMSMRLFPSDSLHAASGLARCLAHYPV